MSIYRRCRNCNHDVTPSRVRMCNHVCPYQQHAAEAGHSRESMPDHYLEDLINSISLIGVSPSSGYSTPSFSGGGGESGGGGVSASYDDSSSSSSSSSDSGSSDSGSSGSSD